jgi:hypothetical protein
MIRFRLSARQAVPPGATAPGSANPPVGVTGDCDSVTTCYTPTGSRWLTASSHC